VYHDKEGKSFFAGQHIDSQNHLTNEKAPNKYLKDVISSVNGADELYILAQQRQKTKLEKNKRREIDYSSKPKSVETADSMTSNQIVAKLNSSISKIIALHCAELAIFMTLSKLQQQLL
jgi:hypothetical protein